MPFEKTQDYLKELIDRTVAGDQQVREGLEESGYEGSEIYDEIARESDSIWEVALDEIRRYDTTEQDYENRNVKFINELGEPPREGNERAGAAMAWVGMLSGLYLLGLIILVIVKLVQNWRQAFGSLITRDGWTFIAIAFVPVVLLIGISGWIEKIQDRKKMAQRNHWEQRHQEWKKKLGELRKAHGLDAAESMLETQRLNIDNLLFERVKQVTIAAINRRTEPSYAPRLDIKKPRGFGEVFDRRFTIKTPARERLQFMLNNMPGGSIGIAGSRGAGKTTLLKLFCGPKRVIETLNDKPVLGALVSAPVAYQARDFILYLFSTVCQNVIEAEGGKYKFPKLPTDETHAQLIDAPALVALRPLPSLLVRVGISLVLISLLIAVGLAALQPIEPKVSTPQRASPPAPSSQAPAAAVSPSQKQGGSRASSRQVVKVQQNSGLQSQDVRAEHQAASDGNEPFASRWVHQLKIDPATILVWGISLFIGGLLLAELLRLGAWRTFSLTIAQLLHGSLGALPIYGTFSEVLLDRQLTKFHEEFERLRSRPFVEMTETPPVDSLWEHAETWLKAIKFQQSYTSGWSGALKLPVGLEGGVNRAVTLAQNQLSLPEVAHFLARFIEEISLKYQVIIGIDEMDKLATDDAAQQFLNDIKSIFGLERCFYLISVSENAMSNFERRGLPFRDVFDSAFDDFVYVDYLNFKAARELLEQRVVGRPIPFFAISYCMSGGLARDLIRSFRSVLEANEQGDNSLTAICKKVVESDLLSKVRATRTSAEKIRIEPELDLLLKALYSLEEFVDSDARLIEAAGGLVASDMLQIGRNSALSEEGEEYSQPIVGSPASRQTLMEDKERVGKLAELCDLSEELGTYIYYAVTLRQFFNDGIQAWMLVQPSNSSGGSLDMLAKARQVIGVEPGIARALLNSFRVAHNLTVLPE